MVEDNKSFFQKWWPELLLLLVSFLMFFVGLGNRGLWGTEGRWACVIQEMLKSKDFLNPTINGTTYLNNPILTYWLILPFTLLTNGINEWSLRIPSAISGMIIVFSSLYLGRKFKSPTAGRIAGWVVMSSYGIMFWSRTGTADAENVAAIMLALAWYWYRREKLNFVTFAIFYLICFLGALTKGLPAIVIPCLVLIPDIVIEKRWKYLIKPSHIIAAVIGLTVYIVPNFLETQTANNFSTIFQENIKRFVYLFGSSEPWYIYFKDLPILISPWFLFFVASFIGLISEFKKQSKEIKWLLISFIIIFLFFTISGSRKSYYILPIIPICAIQIGIFFSTHYQKKTLNRFIQMLAINIQTILASLLIAISIIIPLIYSTPEIKAKILEASPVEPETGVLAATFIAGIIAVFITKYTIRNHSIEHPLLKKIYFNLGIFSLFTGLFFCIITPMLDKYSSLKKFAMTIKEETDKLPGNRIAIYPDNSENLIFYLNRDTNDNIKIISNTDSQKFNEFIQNKDQGILIARRENMQNITNLLPNVNSKPDFDVVKLKALKNSNDHVGWLLN